MNGVWLMLNQDRPKPYVLASGEMHSIRDFLEETLRCAGINFYSMGSYSEEKYVDLDAGYTIVEIDPKFYRPAEVHELCGDPSLAENELGWERKSSLVT